MDSTKHKNRPATLVDVSHLREHPMQNLLFNKPCDDEVADLVNHYKKVGGRSAIQTCADGTIIYGQKTVLASRLAGLMMVPAVIRDDLGNSENGEVLLEMVRQYGSHEPMDEMTIGRCYRELRQTFVGARQRLHKHDVMDIRLALCAGHSFETMEQLGRLADLPRFVQDLITSNKLTKDQANRLRRLPDQDQQLAFKSLEDGGVVIDVLKRHGIDKRQKAARSRQTISRHDPFSDPNHLKKLAKQSDEDQERWLAQLQQVRQQAKSLNILS